MGSNPPPKKEKPPPKKRAITSAKKWDFPASEMTAETQLGLLPDCFTGKYPDDVSLASRVGLLEQLIHSKWYGYCAQDTEKQLFNPAKFVSERDIVQTLIDSRLLCFYCRNPVQLFYEYVRESSQWTVERIDNAFGHNRDNVVIACLGCNLRRRTMYYERFVMTKQMTITKKA